MRLFETFSKKQTFAIIAAVGSFFITLTTIIANIGTIAGFFDKGVKPSNLDITYNAIPIVIEEGETPIDYELSPVNASNNYIKWKSDDTEIADVQNGLVVGKKCGKTKITAYTETGLCDEVWIYVSDNNHSFYEFIDDTKVYTVNNSDDIEVYFATRFEWEDYGFPTGDADVDIKIINNNGETVYDKSIPMSYSEYQRMMCASITKDDIEPGDSTEGKYVFQFVNSNTGIKSKTMEYPIEFQSEYSVFKLPQKVICENINVADGITIEKIEIKNGKHYISLKCDGTNVGLEFFVYKMLANLVYGKYDITIDSNGNKGHFVNKLYYEDGTEIEDYPINWTTREVPVEDRDRALDFLYYFSVTHPELKFHESVIETQRYSHFIS